MADNSLQQALDKLTPSADVTELDLSQYPSTLTETLYIRGGINVRFVNGTLERDKTITTKPLVEIMENSRLELPTGARLAGYRGEYASAITLLSSGELVIEGGEIDGSLGDAIYYFYGYRYNPIVPSVAINSQSGASFIIKSGTLTGNVVNKGVNDVRIYGGTVKGTVSTQQTNILVGGGANIDQITLENNTRVGIISPVENDITIKDVASGEAAVYGHGYQLTPSDIANIWFMDDYKPQLTENTVIAAEWGNERYMWQSNPGHLAYMSEQNQETTEVVSIAGTVNGEDIAMIRKLGQKALKTLDLSHAKLVEGGSYYSIYHPGFPGYTSYYSAKKDTISFHMFGGLDVLENIYLPNGVVNIEDHAFSYCNNLKQIHGLDFVREISGSAFNGCTSLTDFYLDNNDYLVNENGVIYDKEKTKVHAALPANVSGAYILPNTVQEINAYAFSGCKGLYEVQLPESVAKIADYSFSSCSLTNLTIPESLTELGYGSFAYNPITEIHCNNNVPPAIQAFENRASIYVGGTLQYGSFQYVDTLTCKVYVPEGSIEAYKRAPGWSSFRNYVGQISTVDDLQAKLDAIAEKGLPYWAPETVELPTEGVLVDKTLYVRNGCHAKLTGGPLRISPDILDHYCIFINKDNGLHLQDITVDLMGNDFHYNDGVFYNRGRLTLNNVDFKDVPTSTMGYAKCVFWLASGSFFDYYDSSLYANYLRAIIAEETAYMDIYSGEIESTWVPTIDGFGDVKMWFSTVSGGGKGVNIINARTFDTHEGHQVINDLEGGATYINADSINLCISNFINNFGGYGNNIVIGKHANITVDLPVPTLYLKKDASITLFWGLPLQVDWTLDGDWGAFTLGNTIVDMVTSRDDFARMTFLNMPFDREAYYDEAGQRVCLRLKSEDGIEDIAFSKQDIKHPVYDVQGRRMDNNDRGRGLRLLRMSDGRVRKTLKH